MVIGRTRHNDLVLQGNWVSGEHAVIWWDGRWHIRDLGSSNGTTVNGRRLAPGESHQLIAGSEIAFGQVEARWTLETAGPPCATARVGTGTNRQAIDEVLVLPDDAHAWATIWREDGCWQVRDGAGLRSALDRDTLVLGGQTWALRLPDPIDHTVEVSTSLDLSDLEVELTVSRDQETIAVQLLMATGPLPLASRAHHELLLRLAEQLIADQQANLPTDEQGWIDIQELTRRLNINREGLNVQVLRLRRQFTQVGVIDGQQLIERRPQAGQIRVRPLLFHIHQR
jgi:hypothetical protein